MSRLRIVPPAMMTPTHGGGIKPAIVVTECAIHTVTLAPHGSFAAIVHSNPGENGLAVISFLDRDEVEEHIRLLRNAIDDADRIDAGLEPTHAIGGGQ